MRNKQQVFNNKIEEEADIQSLINNVEQLMFPGEYLSKELVMKGEENSDSQPAVGIGTQILLEEADV